MKGNKEMKKRHICKNAIVLYDGNIDEIIKAKLIAKQYPQGSTLASKEDLVDIGDIIDSDYEKAGLIRVKRQFPKFDHPLFSFNDIPNKTNKNTNKILIKN